MKKGKIHIVQVSWDDAVFRQKGCSDSRERQLEYAAELQRQAPGSQMTIIILVRSAGFRETKESNLRLIPVFFDGRKGFVRLFFRLSKLDRESPVDVLTCQDVAEMGWWLLLFGVIKRIPVVGQIHYDLFSPFAQRDFFGDNRKARARYLITLKLLPYFSALRVVSKRIHANLKEMGLKRDIALIPVPVTMIRYEHGNPAGNVRKRKPLVLFVGRLTWQKNLFLWLNIAACVAGLEGAARFRIIGDGPLKDKLKEKAARLGIENRVEFLGQVPYNDLYLHYKEASVFLLTSFSEGFGRVLVESYIHDLPAVATRISGVEDIIEHNVSGFLFDFKEIEGFAKATVRLLKDEDLRTKMAAAGHMKVVDQFNPERLTQKWIALLINHAISLRKKSNSSPQRSQRSQR